MTPSELHRKLLYCGHSDLTDYLMNSPLNRYVYKLLLEMKGDSRIQRSIVGILNEVYYQCVRVQEDDTPGEDVAQRYLKEEEDWLMSNYESQLVFSLVWAIYQLKGKLEFCEECFVNALYPLLSYGDLMGMADKMVQDLSGQRVMIPKAFSPMPAPIAELPESTEGYYARQMLSFFFSFIVPSPSQNPDGGNLWRQVTNNFSQSRIRRYLRLYTSADDQMELLHRIESACTYQERRLNKRYFDMLREKITRNDLQVQSAPAPQQVPASHPYAMMAVGTEAEQVSDPADAEEWEQLLLDQKNSYEMQIARMEAKYQADIAALKSAQHRQNKINALKHRQSNTPKRETQPQRPKEPKELSFTITEIIEQAKERLSKSGAAEISTILYRLCTDHHITDESVFRLVDGIVPAVNRRDVPQTNVDVTSAGQVNINSRQVINQTGEPGPEP